MEQADLTLVVVDCAHLSSDAQQAAAFIRGHLTSVLPTQEQPETGMASSASASPGLLVRLAAILYLLRLQAQ